MNLGRFLYDGIASWLNEGYYKPGVHDFDERRRLIYNSAIRNLREYTTVILQKIYDRLRSENVKSLAEALGKNISLTSLSHGKISIGTEESKALI
ncbi:hypothetical protein F8M41_018567 [Gigaspora margarita]|uniref:Uncharacterized protein n=1 Tax=Gigaspora margarita TaxID=4874 RepID=A0A8H4ELC0_GIGMA|nr:hypothetical protein F8M41_018567 [Gigaspora margarita]